MIVGCSRGICREGSFSWHILRVARYALSFEHLWIACCWRSGNRVSRPLFWWCIRVFPFVYFNSILKFWHPEEQMQQRAICYLIRGAFRVTTDGKVLLESTIWKKVRPSLQQQVWIWSFFGSLLISCSLSAWISLTTAYAVEPLGQNGVEAEMEALQIAWQR